MSKAGLKGAVITDAEGATSSELSRRQVRYVITMLFRLACFVAMFFVPGVWRWVLGAAAVFLPYIAVLLANQTTPRAGPKAVDLDPDSGQELPRLESSLVIEPDQIIEPDQVIEPDQAAKPDAAVGAEHHRRDHAA